MSEIAKIKSFIDSMGYGDKRCGCLEGTKGQNPFITISRQSGAGGNTLATALLEEMKKRDQPLFRGWEMCNQEVCRKVLEEPGITTSIDRLLSSEYKSMISDMMHEIVLGHSSQDVVVKKMFEFLLGMATVGNVIIVGRGGNFLTEHLPLGIHVRLVAPFPERVKHMEGLLNLSTKKAEDLVKSQDKGREKLIKTFFRKNINDPEGYDVVWNTATVPMDDIVYSILELVESRTCHCKMQEGMVAKGN